MAVEHETVEQETPKAKLWINAEKVVRPTDETLAGVGREVVRLIDRRTYPWRVTIEITAS